jgi:hypothetical protein
MLYCRNDTVTGAWLDALLERYFADARTRFANTQGRSGCFFCFVERL